MINKKSSKEYKLITTIELLLPNEFILTDAISQLNKTDNPLWDVTHQAYLFLHKDFYIWAANN